MLVLGAGGKNLKQEVRDHCSPGWSCRLTIANRSERCILMNSMCANSGDWYSERKGREKGGREGGREGEREREGGRERGRKGGRKRYMNMYNIVHVPVHM